MAYLKDCLTETTVLYCCSCRTTLC